MHSTYTYSSYTTNWGALVERLESGKIDTLTIHITTPAGTYLPCKVKHDNFTDIAATETVKVSESVWWWHDEREDVTCHVHFLATER